MEDDQLLHEWEIAKAQGISQPVFAARHGLSVKALNSRLYRQRAKQVSEQSAAPMVEKVERHEDGAEIEFESYSDRIKTVADLVAVCQIDLNKYSIIRSDVRKWDVIIKHPETGQAQVVPAFYVSVKLLPKLIEPARLAITPVSLGSRMPRLIHPQKTKGRGLVLMDLQVGFRRDPLSGKLDPFHDRRALDVVLQVAQDEAFDRVTYIGDLMDCSEMSDKFVREPGFYFTTQPAIIETHWWLQQFKKATPKAEHDAIEGNHDLRLPLSLVNHMLSAYNLTRAGENVTMPVMSLPYLLSMDELGIKYIDGYPNNETFQGPVRIIHGEIARNSPGLTTAALAAQAQEYTIQGHIHRIEMASRTLLQHGQRRVIMTLSAGCLCRVDYVVPGHKHGQQWQQGFAVVEWDGEDVSLQPVAINNGVALYKGWKYKARERLDDLNRDTQKARRGWEY